MKRILSLLICAMLIISSVGVVGFADNNHWSYDYIKGMIADGVISGDQNGNLNLDNFITRAEFAKTVNKYFGYTVKADVGFNDVAADKWYYNDLLIAKGTGYMIGDANGNANADSNITRAEAFVIIARLLGLSDDTSVSFIDEAQIPSWAKGKIGALVKAGIVSGYTDGSINANGNITRAEAFVVVSKNERHEMPSNSTADIDVNGNISSMTHGGSSGGSSGGVSGSGSSSKEATVDIRSFNETTFDIEYSATNFKNVVAVLTFETEGNDGKRSYEIELEPTKQSGKLYKASLSDAIVDIVGKRGANGESFTLTLETDAKSGYKDSEITYNKKVIADILPKLTGFEGGINLETGNYEYSWDAAPGITEYVVNVYSDDALTTKVAELSDVISETSVSFNLDAYPLGTAYYVAVVVKNGELAGAVTAPMAVMAAGISGGNGSLENPFVISNATQFINIFNANNASAALFDKHYILISDIELSSYSVAHIPFKGSLKGADFETGEAAVRKIDIGTIVNDGYTYEVKADTFYAVAGGLFDALEGENASISYLELSGTFKSAATNYIGGVVGCVNLNSSVNNVVTNIAVEATVTSLAGGIAGFNYQGGTIFSCVNNGDVTSAGSAAGIVGCAFDSADNAAPISNCVNTGDISGKTYVAGIVAQNYQHVEKCYNTGSITLDDTNKTSGAAGIVAYNSRAGKTVSECWNSGTLTSYPTNAKSGVGGIVGLTWAADPSREINVKDCFNVGKIVSTSSYKGAAIGNVYGSKSSVSGFYDAVNQDIPVLSDSLDKAAPVVSDAVILSDRAMTGEYGELYRDIWSISEMCNTVGYFKSSEKWMMADGYPLPQLKNNLYNGAEFIMPEPPAYVFTSEVKYQYAPEKSAYTVSWDLDEAVTGYNVYVGSEKVGDAVTTASFDIPASKIATNTEEIMVSAIFDGQEYYSTPIVAYYGGGKGTEADPYLIYTIGHLNNVGLNLDAEFKQMQDISEDLLTPIGSPAEPFTGKYYGADKTNKSVKLKINGGNFVAMFAATKGATIEYITTQGSVSGDGNEVTAFILSDGKTSRTSYAVAALVALTLDGAQTNISNCINEASVSVAQKADKSGAYTGVGGFSGYPMSANFTNCINYGIINAGGTSNVGGIAGYAGDGAVTYCKNYGMVTNGASLGGIVGALYSKTFEYNANIGTVENPKDIQHTGGLVGSVCGNSNVKNSYNSGKVTGGNNTGAITGRVYAAAASVTEISNCFNTGIISGTKQAIAFVDYTRGKTLTVKNIYDTANSKMGIWLTNSSLSANQKADPNAKEGIITVSNAYVLNGTNLTTGGSAITEDELKVLLTSDTTFSSDIWYLDETTDYEYPELKAVKYEFVETLEPTTLTINTSDDLFILNWNLQEGLSYDVYIGGELVATVSTNTYDATDYILGEFSGDVYVVGNKEGVSPSVSNTVAVNGLFAGGKGTQAEPYLISNGKHFKNIASYPSAYYKQTKNIEGITTPISGFKGVYDGDEYSVDVTLSTSDLAANAGFGLFTESTGCTIKNVKVKGTITSTSSAGNQRIGGILGFGNGTVTIDNCVNYATISAQNSGSSSEVAGILGRCYKKDVVVNNCKNYGEISCKGGYASGIVSMAGNAGGGTISNCANYGIIKGGFASGIGGLMYCGISSSYNFGKIEGTVATSRVTGILNAVGSSLTVENCFNAGVIGGTGNQKFSIAASTSTTADRILTINYCYSSASEVSLGDKTATADIVITNSYNVYAEDTHKGNGVTVVTLEALKTTNISNAFTLLYENFANEFYNTDYVYPQLMSNLVPVDFDVPVSQN